MDALALEGRRRCQRDAAEIADFVTYVTNRRSLFANLVLWRTSNGGMTMRSPAMSVSVSDVSSTADVHSAPASEPVIRRIWPTAVIGFALVLTAAWMGLLGYGLFCLVRLAL